MRWVFSLLILFASNANAQNYRLLDVDQMYFESYKIKRLSDPYFKKLDLLGEELVWGVSVGYDLTIFEKKPYSLYWRNKITGMSSERQFRSVAWAFDLGVNFYDKVDIYWDHRSEHLLDQGNESFYPLRDFYGVRIYFLKNEK